MSNGIPLAEQSTATLRRRLALLVHLAAAGGQFSTKLSDAVARTTDAEIRIMSDLVERGLTIPALVHLLQGAHLLVGDDSRYEAWIFPASRRRLSSHHRNVDKRKTPDYGIDGPLVRESLHGKATIGTWVQFERTKANFRWGQLPTWDDALHLRDYVVYRLTGKNVGPWGLSANVDTRPILLRAPHRTSGRGALAGLAVLYQSANERTVIAAETADGSRNVKAPWLRTLSPHVPPVGPVGDLFVAPHVGSASHLLPEEPWETGLGEGLFGSLAVLRWSTQLPVDVSALLDATAPASLVSLDEHLGTGCVDLRVRGATVPTRSVREAGAMIRSLAAPDQEPAVTPDTEPEPPLPPAASSGRPRSAPPEASAREDPRSSRRSAGPEPLAAAADVTRVPADPAAAQDLHAQLVEFAELVRTGPVRLGAYTQAELAVVLGDAPALRGSSPEVLAEAARSLAARGVLFRDPGTDQVTVVGDLGLALALVTARIGTLEIRRGHPGEDEHEPWRWLMTVLPLGVVAIDRVDALGLHRLAVHSTQGVAEVVAERLLGGTARVPRDEPPLPIPTEEARVLIAQGLTRWQLLLRIPQDDRTVLTVEAHVVRTSEHRVDLLTRDPEGDGYTLTAVDSRSLRQFLVDLFATA
jgi:hypothetical protein